jgi:hypothetical protein
MHIAIQKIDEFLTQWPDAEYGPAHVILSDYNLEDHWFSGIMNQLEFAMQQIETGENKYPTHSKEELFATLQFLRELLIIPEDDRCVWDA